MEEKNDFAGDKYIKVYQSEGLVVYFYFLKN